MPICRGAYRGKLRMGGFAWSANGGTRSQEEADAAGKPRLSL